MQLLGAHPRRKEPTLTLDAGLRDAGRPDEAHLGDCGGGGGGKVEGNETMRALAADLCCHIGVDAGDGQAEALLLSKEDR